jgi:hypothetical protein
MQQKTEEFTKKYTGLQKTSSKARWFCALQKQLDPPLTLLQIHKLYDAVTFYAQIDKFTAPT